MSKIEQKQAYGHWKRPSEYMKWSRPEEFSDSIETTDLKLAQKILEYHLETITSRVEELAFEQFARRLAELEVCPNLIPMTGPVGGGDGKVDSENYPVSETIAQTWLIGNSIDASEKEIAIAISAKKDWRGKVRSDVKSIMSTKRPYSVIYFISNQFIKSRARHTVQDDTRRDYSIKLIILDRNWVLEKVFTNGHQQLAVETLHIGDIQIIQKKTTGARDANTKNELDLIEQHIKTPDRYNGLQYQLAEDCLRSALLARKLEQSFDQVEVKFHRAMRIAQKLVIESQLLRITYNKAWTNFFWYDKVDELWDYYSEAEAYTRNSLEADHFEMLGNLWTLLFPKVVRGDYGKVHEEFEDRTKYLLLKLDEICRQTDRPANALKAKYQKNHILAIQRHSSNEMIDDLIDEFSIIAKECEPHLDFPVEQFVHRIEFMGKAFSDNDNYDQLLMDCLDLLERRIGEAQKGKGMMRRGYQLLENGSYSSSVQWFGKAVLRLTKYEYSAYLVRALLGISYAYSELGLDWAARSQLIAAAGILTKDVGESGRASAMLQHVMKRIVWAEIKLGRIPCVINSLNSLNFINSIMEPEDFDAQNFEEEMKMIDSVFSILLIQSSISDLRHVPKYPDLLEKVGCYASHGALLYAMGQEEILKQEGYFEQNASSDDMLEFFKKFFDQPAYKEIDNLPNFLLGDTLHFRTRILGCEISLEVDRTERSVYIGETICSTTESLFATGLRFPIIPHTAKVNVRIIQDSKLVEPLKIEKKDRTIIIQHSSIPMSGNKKHLKHTDDWLMKFHALLLGHFFMIDDFEKVLLSLFKEEEAFSRAHSFANIDILLSNIIGKKIHYETSVLSSL